MDTNEEYWKFAESEKHFNEIQAGIRNLASGWMLAAFGAIALLLKVDANVTWLVPPAVLVGVVSFMASLGLLVLWINDQLVYQRLLDCGFIIAFDMERRDARIPPIRDTMRRVTEGKGMSRWMTCFYTIPLWTFLGLTVAATLLLQSTGGTSRAMNRDQSFAVLLVLGIAQFCVALWVERKRSEVGVRACAARLGRSDLTAPFQGKADAATRHDETSGQFKPVQGRKEEPAKS